MEKNIAEKKLIKNTAIFSIGNIGSKLVTLVTIPLLTFLISLNEYGISDIIMTYIAFAFPVVSLNIMDAVFRYTLSDDDNHNNVLKTAFIFSIIILSCIVPFIYLAYILKYDMIIIFSAYGILFFQIFRDICRQYIRAIQKLKIYVISDILHSIIYFIFLIIYLYFLKLGVYGVLLSYLSTYLLTFIYLFFFGNIDKALQNGIYNSKLIKQMLKYCLPLIPNALMWLIITSISKLFIQSFFNYEISGLYSFATKIPLILSQITAIFISAWQISAVENVGNDDNIFSKKTFNIFYTLGFLIVAFEMVFNKILIFNFVSENYHSSYKYIPIIFLATSFIGLSSFFGSVYVATKKTIGALISTVIAAIVNIVIISITIQNYGLFGVSYAMLISCFIVLIYRIIDTKIRFAYDILNVKFYLSSIIMILGIISYNVYDNNIWINLGIVFIIMIINYKTIIYLFSIIKYYINLYIFKK
jgi:O-antigen/teichoic acid export membrane protein